MNVLFVTDYTAPYEGNFICSIKALCRKIMSQGGIVEFSFPEKARELNWVCELSKIYSVQYRSASPCKQWVELRSLLKSCDIAYTHFCLPKTQCIAKAAVKTTGKALVQHWHNHFQDASGLKKPLFRWAFNGDVNIGCSESVAKSLPFNKDKICYVDNAIDFSRLDNYDETFSFRDTPTQKIVLMFGFDYLRKGVDLALRAVEKICNESDLKLIISLSLSKNHDIILSEIEKLFGEVPSWVQIVDARNDVATYYHAADIFLSAAREEGLCYSPLEAAYCECSLISSNIDGVPYWNIPNCYTFESEQVGKLQEKLSEVIAKDRITLSRENAENKAAVVSKYSLNLWVNGIIEKLESVV